MTAKQPEPLLHTKEMTCPYCKYVQSEGEDEYDEEDEPFKVVNLSRGESIWTCLRCDSDFEFHKTDDGFYNNFPVKKGTRLFLN